MNTLTDNLGNTLRQQGPAAALWLFLAFALILFLNLGLQIYRVSTAAPTLPAAPRQHPAEQARADAIGAAQLFGPLDPAAADATVLPETELQLTLRGVFTSDIPQQSSAIIEKPDGTAGYHRLGAEVVPGTRLEAVHRDRVVLARNGQYESLYFPTPETLSTEAAAMATQLPAGVELENVQQVQQMMSDPATGQTIDPQRLKQLQQEEIDKRRAMVRQKLEELRARARAQ